MRPGSRWLHAQLILSAALGLASAACGSDVPTTDAGLDAGPTCGAGRIPTLDWACHSHVGCQTVNQAGCGCRCTKCDNEQCVEQSCEPACGSDAGSDTGVVHADGSSDAQSGDAGFEDTRPDATTDTGGEWDGGSGIDAEVDAGLDAGSLDATADTGDGTDSGLEKDTGNLSQKCNINNISTTWCREAVLAPHYFEKISSNAVKFTPDNIPHIVFGGDNLYHAFLTGDSWEVEVIDDTPGTGGNAIMAVDSKGGIHVVYDQDYTDFSRNQRYATNIAGTWHIEDLTSRFINSIAVDSNGFAHFIDGRYHITNRSGTWVSTQFDRSGTYISGGEIAVDSTGNAHVVYPTGYKLNYATDASGQWMTEQLGDFLPVGSLSIAVDPSDAIHIIIDNDAAPGILEVTNRSGAWVFTLVTEINDPNTPITMTIDEDGVLHIGWSVYGSSSVWYGTNKEGAWNVFEIPTVQSPKYPSIAANAAGSPSIAFIDAIFNQLFIATSDGVGWQQALIDQSGDIQRPTQITAGNDNSANILVADDSAGKVYHLSNSSGTWTKTDLFSDWNPSGNCSYAMAIDNNDFSHVSYEGPGLLYTTNASGQWVSEVVDSDTKVGFFNDIAMDSTGGLHISYIDSANDKLKYASKVGGSWQSTTVTDGGLSTSINIDSNNNVHICHVRRGETRTLYTTNASGAWTTDVVEDNPTEYFRDCAMALDSKGKAHLIYNTGIMTAIRYATNASGAWVVRGLDIGPSGPSDIAVDSNDVVHIAGFSEPLNAFVHVDNATGDFIPDVVDATPGAGGRAALTIDAHNNIHISYFNTLLHDPMYAVRSQ